MAQLSQRMQRPTEALLPKINSSLAQRNDPAQSVNLATAENWLIRKEVLQIYRKALQTSLTCADLSYVDGLSGEPGLLAALATFVNKYFKPAAEIKPRHIVVTPGASNCLDSLLFSLCEPGDSVLVLAPYWNGFDVHLAIRPNVRIVPVYTTPIAALETFAKVLPNSLIPALSQALATVEDKTKVKALIVSNPHNPFATCYTKEVLREAIQWCAKQDLHYISDEIYALSDFAQMQQSQSCAPFISALAVDLDPLQTPPISTIWGTSKDLGSSGLRIGVHVARPSICEEEQGANHVVEAKNALLTTSLGLLSALQLSTVSMAMTRALLLSEQLDKLVTLNKTRLRHNYTIISTRLRFWNIPFLPATSAPYLVAKLGSGLKARLESQRVGDSSGTMKRHDSPLSTSSDEQTSTISDDETVVQFLKREALVLVAPCTSFHMGDLNDSHTAVDDWVRITFAIPVILLNESLDRIERTLGLPSFNFDRLGLPQSGSGTGTLKRPKCEGEDITNRKRCATCSNIL
ncbi:hypothetical protein CKM354_000379400 [Cercospora kikuchii]|uniref:Aminotransferase class I/classII large domain-containing protein n=1 Tax=Cercospora kikuchii TaxID=84275 RepID=A0A9P3FE16_9PEZI|nr:uncharacterized protein CKM354_000379400 [Cercospora kikuchii]GIZ40457.1 hypothetical protein CKM354_000379400 [Cercospora kikuchii]